MAVVRTPRITVKDKAAVVDRIHAKLEVRKRQKFRKDAEKVWKEVDRQIQMVAPISVKKGDGTKDNYENTIQLGHLADALEIKAADELRLAFPTDRKWFRPHADLDRMTNFLGINIENIAAEKRTKVQNVVDNVYRNLMIQQHVDFGLRDRVKLSLKEALAHGGVVVDVRWDTMHQFPKGVKIRSFGAPVWQPHSMWNCYPDPSPGVVGTDLFYRGSMIIEETVEYAVLKANKKFRNLDKITPNQEGFVDLVKYYGDIAIPRSQGPDVLLPNRLWFLVKDQIIWGEVNELDHSPIIYFGYERDNVLNPYFSSPLIKRSPSLKLSTHLANKFIDAVDIKTRPPIAYSSVDPNYADSDGPVMEPGAKIPTISTADIKVLDVGDPQSALVGVQYFLNHVNEGLSLDRVRKGVSDTAEQTATEVIKKEQRGEVREIDFVGIVERQGLLPFLYMQHAYNLKKLDNYSFYNDEPHTDDFLRVSKDEIPKEARFEITGSRQILGEERRTQATMQMHAFALSNPLMASRVDVNEILRQGYEDAGQKDPERFVVADEGDQVEQAVQAAVQQVQAQAQEEMTKMQEQIARLQAQQEVQMMRAQQELQLDTQKQQAELELKATEQERKAKETQAEIERRDAEVKAKIDREDALAEEKIQIMRDEAAAKALQMQQESQKKEEKERAEAEKPVEEKVTNINFNQGKSVRLVRKNGQIAGAEVSDGS